jgi:ubiquitin-protein ligase E3 D
LANSGQAFVWALRKFKLEAWIVSFTVGTTTIHTVQHPSTAMPSTYLYAEFLSNIRQVTLYASLESDTNDETEIQLTSDRKSLSLSYNGETATILLPNEISGTVQLTVPTNCAKELSFRLQVAEVKDPFQNIVNADSEVPWPANTFNKTTQIRCRACGRLIIETSIIQSWKDLPSEYWADMMDFWHCHKPHDHGDHAGQHGEDNTVSKGYSSSTKVTAQSGIGLVDISSFLFAEEDCHGVKVSSLHFNILFSVIYACSSHVSTYGHKEGDHVPSLLPAQ